MKTLFIVCVFTLLFITLLIFNKILIFKNKFGKINVKESECVPNTKYCIDGGKKLTIKSCTPNASTKYGCLDENNNQFFASKYSISSSCKPACKENIITVVETTDCEYPIEDIQNECTKYNTGRQRVVKQCTHFDDSGISTCNPNEDIPYTVENCVVTKNTLPTCGYYYYESNGEIIKCSSTNSKDSEPVSVTDDTCFTDTTYTTKMNDMSYYGIPGFLNPNTVFKCSNNSCIPSEINFCEKKCIYEGGSSSVYPLIQDLQEGVFNFWITANNSYINNDDLTDQIKSHLLVAQTQTCFIENYPSTNTPEQIDEFRKNFYYFPDPHNNTHIYGKCNVDPTLIPEPGYSLDFSEVRFVNLYPDNTKYSLDICGLLNTCENNNEILKANLFQYNNGLIFTIIPMSVDPIKSHLTHIEGNFCIIAHSFGQTYALTYSEPYKHTGSQHIRLKIVPIDINDIHSRQKYTMYGMYTANSVDRYFTLITHTDEKYFILNKYDKEFKDYVQTKYKDTVQFRLVKLDKNNHNITINGHFCETTPNIMFDTLQGDYDYTC